MTDCTQRQVAAADTGMEGEGLTGMTKEAQ
jgi:hypothetical protein